ncbi:glycerophosphodiester phosphodiesterase domain-containing protein 4 isoform X2 [Rhineura floridana]|uniref:glycerophosphodiester phosphodiesterase domain-containing protein 4 isoform X2 n=1 Tax=Rhineura floridana TaxID=261503 RepID=UPI002AC857AE|nr:glycerophosphodiester phosphodiesterase domain-containing protein 4 isoform X2 [Rhineura floridana]
MEGKEIEVLQMESSNTTIKKCRLGRLRKPRAHIPPDNEHQSFICCLTGLYSCQWKWNQRNTVERGHWCCGAGECTFFLLVCLAFCLWFIFLYLWGEIKNDYHSFDWYNYGNFGFWFHWSTLFLIIAAIIFSYLLFLLILAVCLISESQRLYLHWSHKIVMVFALSLSFLAIAMVTLLWSKQWNTFCLSFQVTAPFLHIVAIFIMILLAWPVALHFFWINNKVVQVLIILPYLAILLFLLFIPLGMYSPCILEKGALGPKPSLIGHRGAPMVAPENTEMSFKKAVAYGAIGFETDVTISFDGVPFLMHDSTLKRTTNVEDVYPKGSRQLAAFFPWEYLENLNSGNWFFQNRPFFEMPSLSPEDKILARNQRIYQLTDLLKLAKQENKFVIFDLYRPPKSHPYRDTWISRTAELVQNEMGNKSHLEICESQHHIQLLGGQRAMAILLGLVLWSSFCHHRCHPLPGECPSPFLLPVSPCSFISRNDSSLSAVVLQTPKEYRSMWIVTDVMAVLLIAFLFSIHWWREVGRFCCEGESHTTINSDPYHVSETELGTMPTVV